MKNLILFISLIILFACTEDDLVKSDSTDNPDLPTTEKAPPSSISFSTTEYEYFPVLEEILVGPTHFYTYDLTDSTLIKVVEDIGFKYKRSLDGKLAHYNNVDKIFYITDLRTGSVMKEMNFDPPPRFFAWSNDGSKLAISFPGPVMKVIDINTDETLNTIEAEGDSTFYGPTWSPDDQSIGYGIGYSQKLESNATLARGELFIANLSHTVSTPESHIRVEMFAETSGPRILGWSSNSQSLYYGQTSSVFKFNTSGTLSRLTGSRQIVSIAAMAPEGQKIAYSPTDEYSNEAWHSLNTLYLINGDGSNNEELAEIFDIKNIAWDKEAQNVLVGADKGIYSVNLINRTPKLLLSIENELLIERDGTQVWITSPQWLY